MTGEELIEFLKGKDIHISDDRYPLNGISTLDEILGDLPIDPKARHDGTLSNAGLSKLVGRSDRTIARYRSGESPIPADVLAALFSGLPLMDGDNEKLAALCAFLGPEIRRAHMYHEMEFLRTVIRYFAYGGHATFEELQSLATMAAHLLYYKARKRELESYANDSLQRWLNEAYEEGEDVQGSEAEGVGGRKPDSSCGFEGYDVITMLPALVAEVGSVRGEPSESKEAQEVIEGLKVATEALNRLMMHDGDQGREEAEDGQGR